MVQLFCFVSTMVTVKLASIDWEAKAKEVSEVKDWSYIFKDFRVQIGFGLYVVYALICYFTGTYKDLTEIKTQS